MPARRSVLASIGLGLAGAFGGCSTLSGAVNESTSNETEQKSVSPPAAAKSASTATGEATSTTESALEYALAYERHYLAYRAIYALGPQTPDSQTDGPTHDFPDVRLGEVDAEATQRSGDRVVVRLTYDRLFEGESQGEFTVKYPSRPTGPSGQQPTDASPRDRIWPRMVAYNTVERKYERIIKPVPPIWYASPILQTSKSDFLTDPPRHFSASVSSCDV